MCSAEHVAVVGSGCRGCRIDACEHVHGRLWLFVHVARYGLGLVGQPLVSASEPDGAGGKRLGTTLTVVGCGQVTVQADRDTNEYAGTLRWLILLGGKSAGGKGRGTVLYGGVGFEYNGWALTRNGGMLGFRSLSRYSQAMDNPTFICLSHS